MDWRYRVRCGTKLSDCIKVAWKDSRRLHNDVDSRAVYGKLNFRQSLFFLLLVVPQIWLIFFYFLFIFFYFRAFVSVKREENFVKPEYTLAKLRKVLEVVQRRWRFFIYFWNLWSCSENIVLHGPQHNASTSAGRRRDLEDPRSQERLQHKEPRRLGWHRFLQRRGRQKSWWVF